MSSCCFLCPVLNWEMPAQLAFVVTEKPVLLHEPCWCVCVVTRSKFTSQNFPHGAHTLHKKKKEMVKLQKTTSAVQLWCAYLQKLALLLKQLAELYLKFSLLYVFYTAGTWDQCFLNSSISICSTAAEIFLTYAVQLAKWRGSDQVKLKGFYTSVTNHQRRSLEKTL